MSRSRRISARGLLLCALALVALLAPVWGPHVLRRVPWFTVDRVEVSGTRLLAPQTVLAASGIRAAHNVWDDAARWERALRGHPAIAEAEVRRRLPGTLRVRVREKQPVALLEMGALHPVTADGEMLPLDPARAPVDLPILRAPHAARTAAPGAGPDAVLADSSVAALLAALGRLRQLDPALTARLSEVRADSAGVRLMLSRPDAEILLRGSGLGDEARLRQLRAVIADLERRAPAPGEEPVRVDARYADQVVVRLSSPV